MKTTEIFTEQMRHEANKIIESRGIASYGIKHSIITLLQKCMDALALAEQPKQAITREDLADIDEEIIVFDDLDSAIIGYSMGVIGQDSLPIAVYSFELIVDSLIKNSNMSLDEAIEYAEYNIVGAYYGKRTPLIIYDPLK